MKCVSMSENHCKTSMKLPKYAVLNNIRTAVRVSVALPNKYEHNLNVKDYLIISFNP